MFIFNSDYHLIAADPQELERWGFSDLFEASRAFREGSLRLEKESATLHSDTGESQECELHTVESFLGTWIILRQREDLPLLEEEHKEETPLTLTAPSSPSSPDQVPDLSDEIQPIQAPLIEEEESKEKIEEKEEEEFILELLQTELEEEVLEEPKEDEELKTPEVSDEEDEELIPLDDTLPLEESTEKKETEQEESKEEVKEEEEPFFLDLLDEETSSQEQTKNKDEKDDQNEAEKKEEDEIVELSGDAAEILPVEEVSETPPPQTFAQASAPTEPLMPLPETPERPWESIAKRFQPDIETGARQIDLSLNEYSELIADFVQDSRQLRNRLLSDHPQERQGAVAVLKDAIALLHLAPLDELLGELEQAAPHERLEIVAEYERLLDRLDQTQESPVREEESQIPEPQELQEQEREAAPKPATSEEEIPVELPTEEKPQPTPPSEEPKVEEPATVSEKEEEVEKAAQRAEEKSEIDVDAFLEGVQPVPIEFSLHIAAEELSLPEDLVLEFINDFDKQGHEYLPVLIQAYQEKDLSHLQKTAHMLKGAASNLRIEAMVDNLYALQYDNDIERAPERIRLFAGQLMSLDKYLEQMNSQGS